MVSSLPVAEEPWDRRRSTRPVREGHRDPLTNDDLDGGIATGENIHRITRRDPRVPPLELSQDPRTMPQHRGFDDFSTRRRKSSARILR